MDYPRLPAKEAEVLRLLIANGEMYGLELVKSSADLKRGTVYVILSRMADKGYVNSRLEEVGQGGGPPRRVFTVTGLGARVYHALQTAARVFAAGEGAWAL
jgi:DNA-binding PadR family transcriptional regulator